VGRVVTRAVDEMTTRPVLGVPPRCLG
jgi:hypothetical protein